MNDTITLDPDDTHGQVLAADTVRLERLLPGPIERLWRYLTDTGLRSQWLAAGGGGMDLRVGGAVELVFRNGALTTPDDPPPAKYASATGEHRLVGHVTACDPPRLLAYTWNEQPGKQPSEVRFELTPRGDKVQLVLTHRRLADREGMLSVSAGWHTHLALLRARLEGRQMQAFWRTFQRLEAEYEQRLG